MCCASAAAVWSRTGCSPKQLLCTSTHYDLDSGESRSLDIMNEFYGRRRNIICCGNCGPPGSWFSKQFLRGERKKENERVRERKKTAVAGYLPR